MQLLLSEVNIVDVGNDSHDHLRTGDVPNITDSSISTQGSASPQSSAASSTSSPDGSTRSSPGSAGEPATSPENSEEQTTKKKPRTNYTNEQVQTLLKIFHENPYPDSEMMENISKDMGIPENKIKVSLQVSLTAFFSFLFKYIEYQKTRKNGN